MKNLTLAKRTRAIKWFLFIMLISHLWLVSYSSAQTTITTYCDAIFDESQYHLPSVFPGTYYRIVSGNVLVESVYRFELINQFGSLQFDAPFSSEQVHNFVAPVISPDGRFMAFQPASPEIPLTVWKIGTTETTSLLLTAEEYDYLTHENFRSYARSQNKLIWIDASHLRLQYFSTEIAGTFDDPLIAFTDISLTENPLQLQRGTLNTINYPNLLLPAGDYVQFNGMIFSPLQTYTTLSTAQVVTGYGHAPRLQIYDNGNGQLVYDRIPTLDSIPISLPSWTADESTFFFNIKKSDHSLEIMRVNISQQGFVEDSSLQQALETNFGADVSILTDPIFNSDRSKMAFQVASYSQHADYIIIYTIATGQMTAICNPFFSSPEDTTYPFWLPGEQYFAYWDNGDINVFDINTGDTYQLPGRSFVGWIAPIAGLGNIPSFSLLASDNSVIADPLANNAELSDLPASVKFRANSNPATVGSVKFELSGSASASFTDDSAPYELDWTPVPGSYTLSATPYSGAGGTGTAGSPLSINFSLSNSLNRILFRHGSHIYLMNADGSNPVDLGAGESPSFSPDGSRIAFQLNGTAGREIWTMNADGTNRLQLTNNNIDDRNPSWSPDGSRIVYCSVNTGADWELFIINADGTNRVQLTSNGVDDTDPVWSSTDVIAFVSMPDEYKRIFTIWPDGTHRSQITTGLSNTVSPEWSPDGSMIVFNTWAGSNNDIRRVNANGTNGIRLTDHAASDSDAEWSPDGSQIIFSSMRTGGANHELYIMNADGSAETRFTFTSFDELQAAWGYP